MYTVDGLEPEDDGYLLFITGSSIRGNAGRVDAPLELPGRDGELPQLGSAFLPGNMTLRYRILVSTHAEFMALIEKFNGVFGQRHRMLPIIHTYGESNTRINYGTVVQSIEPEPVTNVYAYYQVTMRLPSPFWRSEDTPEIITNPLTSTLTVQTLTGFAGTGPVNDAIIRIKGGFSTARVIDAVSGDQLDIDIPVAGTEYVIIDTANWAASLVTSDTWSGGTDISASVSSNRGRGDMFRMEPDNVLTGGRYRLRMRATNPSSNPVVEIRARRSYH